MKLRRYLSSALATVVAAMTVTVVSALPAAAVEPFGNPTAIVGSNCAFGNGDGTGSSNGTVRGAVDCNAENDGPIYAFWYQDGIRTVVRSPYTGQVIATAWDGSNYDYILFQQGTSLKIAKVSDAAAFTVPSVLSTTLSAYTGGDVVAVNGKWYAVWSEMVGDQAELYQARTLFGTHPRARITTSTAQDLEPRLAYTSGRVELIWSRYAPEMGSSDLWLAGTTNGSWSSRVFATSGLYNNMADIAGSAGRFYVSWTRDGVIIASTNVSGAWVSRAFGTHGYNSRIATAGGRIDVSYEAVDLGGRIYVVERAGGVWTGGAITGSNAGNFGIFAADGRATSLYYSINGLSARQQS